MKRTECYAIGVCQKNAKNEDVHGYLAVTGTGKIIIANSIKDVHNFQPLLDVNKGYLAVAETREDAELLVRWLSRAYRKSFREYVKKHNLSMDDFKFFMVKMSNPAFDDFSFKKLDGLFYGLSKMKTALFTTKGVDNSFRGNPRNVNLYEVTKIRDKANITVMMPRK